MNVRINLRRDNKGELQTLVPSNNHNVLSSSTSTFDTTTHVSFTPQLCYYQVQSICIFFSSTFLDGLGIFIIQLKPKLPRGFQLPLVPMVFWALLMERCMTKTIFRNSSKHFTWIKLWDHLSWDKSGLELKSKLGQIRTCVFYKLGKLVVNIFRNKPLCIHLRR